MFNNASKVDASHSTFSEVHRDQHVYSRAHVQGNQTVNTIVHGNQIFQGSLGLENLLRASVPGAAFDSIDRHPAPTCLPGTRLELLARLTEWIDDPNCDQRICWLSGLAGSGKSAIAQSIAEKYATQRRLAASFFFSRKEILRGKAHGFFPTLACQLLVFAPSIKPALLGALDADAMIPTKVLLEQARKLLQEPILSSTTSFPDPILIVVDSLDECDDAKMMTEIIHLLAGILHGCRWPLKVLFTSRAESYIVRIFQHSKLRSATRLLQLQNFDADNDIRIYLRHSFEGIRESMDATSLSNCPTPWPSEDEIEMIVQRAAGLFIFATTVVKHIGTEHGSPVVQLKEVLGGLESGMSPESAFVQSPVDTLYLDTLRTFQDTENVRLVLGLVVFAFRSLSIHGLNDLLWNVQLDASFIIKNLHSVLIISDCDNESDGPVSIYHTSFRDFLTAAHRSQQYFVDPVVFHSTLARACLELMIRHLMIDPCGIGDPSTLNCEVEDLDKRCKLRIKEGVRYACRWFAQHLSHVPWDKKTVDDALVLSLQGFSRRCILNWLEVLSLTGELDSAVLSLRECVNWLKRSPKPYEETLSLLRDAERLVLLSYDLIRQAALQVYYSLPYTPTLAQIRTTYAHELKNKFVITRGLDEYWNPCLRSIFTGSCINSVAISPSGHLIASVGDTPGVQLWDPLTGSNTDHFHGSGTSTCPVIFSGSGDYVAVGCDTGSVDVWDVATGQRILDPNKDHHGASVKILAFSRNGLFIASGAADATVHLWDISAGTLKHTITSHKGPILCLSFSPSDGLIASGSEDSSIVLSNVKSGQMVRAFEGHISQVNAISFSSDGGSLASGSDDKSVRLWNARSGECLQTLSGMHKKPIHKVCFTADDKHIISVSDLDIYMSEINSKSPHWHVWSMNHYLKKLATMIPVAWFSTLAKVTPSRLIGRLAGTDDGTVLYTAFSPDGTAIGCAHGSLVFLLEPSAPQQSWSRVRHPLARLPTMDEPPMVGGPDDDLTTIAMSHDKTLLVTSAEDGTIIIWSASTKREWKTCRNKLQKTVDKFWPSTNGSLLIQRVSGIQLVGTSGTSIKDLETGGDFLSESDAVQSPDSRYFAYWSEYMWKLDGSYCIYIFNATTGARLKRIPGFFEITCVRFSAESDLLGCAHGDGIIQIWELSSMLCKTTIETGHAAITAMEFLPGSISLVVGSDKGCVEIRSVEDGDVLHHIKYSTSQVMALAIPTGALIVVIAHADGSMFVWDPSYPNLAPHCLSPGMSKEASDNVGDDPNNAVEFVKFTEGYRSLCSRSLNGVICTWDLTHCLAEYAEHAEEITQSDPPNSDPSDEVKSPTYFDGSKTRGNVENHIGSISAEASGELQTTTSQVATTEPAPPDTPTSSSTIRPQCPHLVSRSESHIVYDRYFRSTYSIDKREGWVYRGSKRMFWLPSEFRPSDPTALSAHDDRLAIQTWSRRFVVFDLRPMTEAASTV